MFNVSHHWTLYRDVEANLLIQYPKRYFPFRLPDSNFPFLTPPCVFILSYRILLNWTTDIRHGQARGLMRMAATASLAGFVGSNPVGCMDVGLL
jgi:hypothetical protein